MVTSALAANCESDVPKRERERVRPRWLKRGV